MPVVYVFVAAVVAAAAAAAVAVDQGLLLFLAEVDAVFVDG